MAASEAEDLPVRIGTLAWLREQDVVERDGRMLPACHRVPEDARLLPTEPEDSRCAVSYASGERCGAPRVRIYGVCAAHAGGGGLVDKAASARRAHKAKAKLRYERQMIGLRADGKADPRQLARLAALRRSEALAEALVDGPLDDPEMSAFARQTAAIRALDATFPIQTAELTVELPSGAGQLQGMGWQELQQLAAVLLHSEDTDPSLDS